MWKISSSRLQPTPAMNSDPRHCFGADTWTGAMGRPRTSWDQKHAPQCHRFGDRCCLSSLSSHGFWIGMTRPLVGFGWIWWAISQVFFLMFFGCSAARHQHIVSLGAGELNGTTTDCSKHGSHRTWQWKIHEHLLFLIVYIHVHQIPGFPSNVLFIIGWRSMFLDDDCCDASDASQPAGGSTKVLLKWGPETVNSTAVPLILQ
jgi:hypothetical protein